MLRKVVKSLEIEAFLYIKLGNKKVSKTYLKRKVNKKNLVFSMLLEVLNHCHNDIGKSIIEYFMGVEQYV